MADPHYDLAFTTLMLANPPLGGPAPVRAATRAIGTRLANRFLRTYEQRTGRPVDATRLAWGRRAHALRALVEIATWEANDHLDAHRGHPWLTMRPVLEAHLLGRRATMTPEHVDATARRYHMTATIGLVLDCTDPTELARFWSEALGYTTVGGAGNYVMLVDPDNVRPKLLLQAVPEAKAVKNRMHLDIETPDVEDVPAVGEVVGDQQGDDGRQRLLTQSGQGDRLGERVIGEGIGGCGSGGTPGGKGISTSQFARARGAGGAGGDAVRFAGGPVTELLLAPDDMPGDIADRPLGAGRRRIPAVRRHGSQDLIEALLGSAIALHGVHGYDSCWSAARRRISSSGATSSTWEAMVHPWPNGSTMKPSRSP